MQRPDNIDMKKYSRLCSYKGRVDDLAHEMRMDSEWEAQALSAHLDSIAADLEFQKMTELHRLGGSVEPRPGSINGGWR